MEPGTASALVSTVEALATPHPSSTPLSGPLSSDSLVRVLRATYLGGHTGVLNLSRGRERLGLRFLGGRIVSGADGPVGRLGDILLRLGQVTRADLERALEKAALEGVRLGPVLVAERMATREQVQEALRLQVRDVLFAAFFWGFGAYRFEADQGPDLHEDINLEMSTPGLIFDVVSCLESPGGVLQSLADPAQPIAAAADWASRLSRDRVKLSPADEHVLSRADGVTPVRQVVGDAALPAPAVERSLVALLCCGAVRLLPLPAPAKSLPSPDQTLALPRASLGLGLPSPDETVAMPRTSLGLDEIEEKRREAARMLQEMERQTHFAVLGLPEGAPFEDVKRAFVRLAKRYHPDTVRDPELGVLTKAIFLRVSEACNVLASGDSRARYEQRLGGPSRRSAPPPTPAPAPVATVQCEEPSGFSEPADVVRRAEELLAGGELFEAATLLTDILPHTEGRLRQRARLLRARTYLRTPSGSHLAETEVRELLQDEPACVEACVLLGDIYRDHGLARRAETQYQRALELRPGHTGAAEQLAALAGAVAVPRAIASARR
jgi:hypothetical protein